MFLWSISLMRPSNIVVLNVNSIFRLSLQRSDKLGSQERESWRDKQRLFTAKRCQLYLVPHLQLVLLLPRINEISLQLVLQIWIFLIKWEQLLQKKSRSSSKRVLNINLKKVCQLILKQAVHSLLACILPASALTMLEPKNPKSSTCGN